MIYFLSDVFTLFNNPLPIYSKLTGNEVKALFPVAFPDKPEFVDLVDLFIIKFNHLIKIITHNDYSCQQLFK